MKVVVLYGSVRTERLGFRVAKLVENELKARGADVVMVDPKELDLPFIDYRYEEMESAGTLTPKLAQLGADIREAVGIVFVSAEYNHGIPAPLKNIIDVCGGLFKNKIGGIVTYSMGGVGGARAATQLRVSPGGLITMIPAMMNIPAMHESVSDDGTPQNEGVKGAAKLFHDQFIWWAEALKDKLAKA